MIWIYIYITKRSKLKFKRPLNIKVKLVYDILDGG